ncbi:MAG TPA: alpha-hydroxy-acid oxidizing protein [Micromonosporaceae bacterium]|nr:alpha-hydroxy-acid oxidizing protein [Micromonosporaceae bacterium]
MPSEAEFQNEIYAGGLDDVRPPLPTDLTRLEALAKTYLSDRAYGYVAGAAGSGSTARANRDAFERWRIVPRLLRDVDDATTATEVLGTPMRAPVMLAPIGALSIYHRDAERLTARAAGSVDAPMILSTMASTALEDVANVGGGPKWFQLYWPRDRDLAASFVSRAAAAGYRALVVTIDTYRLAWRPLDLDNAFLPFLLGEGLANYFSDPVFQQRIGGPVTADRVADGIGYWRTIFGNPALTWADLGWLRERWTGPIVLKGIQHPDDARRAADAGVDGIVVSNHGGRQIDGAIASLDALPGVVDAAGDRLDILFDSGIRGGGDVVKALALGAKAVLVGRPYVYGLAIAGEAGVRHVLRCLYAETELTMTLAGASRPAEVSADMLVRA